MKHAKLLLRKQPILFHKNETIEMLQKAFRLKLSINTLSNPSVSKVKYICTMLSHTNVVNKQHYNFTTD